MIDDNKEAFNIAFLNILDCTSCKDSPDCSFSTAEYLPKAALYNTSNPCILAFKKGMAEVITLKSGSCPLLPKLIISSA